MTNADSFLAARNRDIYELWKTIQDVIRDANKSNFALFSPFDHLTPYENEIDKETFWARNLIYFQRCLVSAFLYVNGLNPEIFME